MSGPQTRRDFAPCLLAFTAIINFPASFLGTGDTDSGVRHDASVTRTSPQRSMQFLVPGVVSAAMGGRLRHAYQVPSYLYSSANSVKVCWKKSPVHVINLPALSQPHPSVFLLHTCLSDDDDIASCFVKPPSRSILNLIYTHDAACDTKSKQSGQAGQIKQTVSRHPRSGPASTYCRTP